MLANAAASWPPALQHYLASGQHAREQYCRYLQVQIRRSRRGKQPQSKSRSTSRVKRLRLSGCCRTSTQLRLYPRPAADARWPAHYVHCCFRPSRRGKQPQSESTQPTRLLLIRLPACATRANSATPEPDGEASLHWGVSPLLRDTAEKGEELLALPRQAPPCCGAALSASGTINHSESPSISSARGDQTAVDLITNEACDRALRRGATSKVCEKILRKPCVHNARARIHELLQGSRGRQALSGAGVHQRGERIHQLLHCPRWRQALWGARVHQVGGGIHQLLQGSRRRQALRGAGVHPGCRRIHQLLHRSRRRQALSRAGVYQGCERIHQLLQGSWRRQALSRAGVHQVGDRIHQLLHFSRRWQALSRAGVLQVSNRINQLLRRPRGRQALSRAEVHQVGERINHLLQGPRRRQALSRAGVHQVGARIHQLL